MKKKETAKQKLVHEEMTKFKKGELHSGKKGPGKGKVVKSRKQAIAIALNVSGQSKKKKK